MGKNYDGDEESFSPREASDRGRDGRSPVVAVPRVRRRRRRLLCGGDDAHADALLQPAARRQPAHAGRARGALWRGAGPGLARPRPLLGRARAQGRPRRLVRRLGCRLRDGVREHVGGGRAPRAQPPPPQPRARERRAAQAPPRPPTALPRFRRPTNPPSLRAPPPRPLGRLPLLAGRPRQADDHPLQSGCVPARLAPVRSSAPAHSDTTHLFASRPCPARLPTQSSPT